MGRSRGGLTTKRHALVDAEGRPVILDLSAGQAHDGRAAEGLLDLLGEGDILLADRQQRHSRHGRQARRLGQHPRQKQP